MDLPVNYRNVAPSYRRLVREEYARRQGGDCYYCGDPLEFSPSNEIMCIPVDASLFPPSFFEYPVHLHHDHNTGMTIGAVHCQCNAILWQYHGE